MDRETSEVPGGKKKKSRTTCKDRTVLAKMDEALFSATYVDNYIDSVENLPHDVQRQLTMIRDIDVQYRSKFSIIKTIYKKTMWIL